MTTSRKGCWSLKVALQPNTTVNFCSPKREGGGEERESRRKKEEGRHSELNSERDKTVPSPLPPVCSVSRDSTHTFICSSPYLEFISTFRSVLMQASSSALLYIYSYFVLFFSENLLCSGFHAEPPPGPGGRWFRLKSSSWELRTLGKQVQKRDHRWNDGERMSCTLLL